MSPKHTENRSTHRRCPQKILVEITAFLGIRTSPYKLVKRSIFNGVHIGIAIRIHKETFEEWMAKIDM